MKRKNRKEISKKKKKKETPVHAQPTEENHLPEKWPDGSLNDCKVSVIKCDVPGPMYDRYLRSQGQDSEDYKNQSVPRGKAVIINNYDFKAARDKKIKLDDRDGTEKDLSTLDTLFGQLHYKVEIFRDLSQQKILDTIQAIAQDDHSAYDSFVFVILTHGKKDNIYGVDGKCLRIKSIISSFKGSKCPTLVGKPKLFFFQACQGKCIDTGVTVQPAAQASDKPDNYEVILKKMPSSNVTTADNKNKYTVQTETDIFIASATVPDYVSWRNAKKGTWFIQAVVYVFQNFACKDSLEVLMTKVNRLVNRCSTKFGELQVSQYTNRLTKYFYFFPGLPPQNHCQPTN